MLEYKIVHKKIKDLVPYADNPRVISEEAKAGLGESIRSFGLVDPIVVNKTTGRVIGGHQRLRELAEAGVEETDVLEGEMPEKDEIALNIALNSKFIQGEFEKSAIKILDRVHEELEEVSENTLLDKLREQLGGKKKDKEEPGDKEDGEKEKKEKGQDDDIVPAIEKIVPPFAFVDVENEEFKKIDYALLSEFRNEKHSVVHPGIVKCLFDWFCPDGGVPGSSDNEYLKTLRLISGKCIGLPGSEKTSEDADVSGDGFFRADDIVYRAVRDVVKEEGKVVASGTFYGRRLEYLTRMAKDALVELHLLEKYREHPKIQQAIYAGVQPVFHFTDKDVEEAAKSAEGWKYDVEDIRIVEGVRKRFDGIKGSRAVVAVTDGVIVAGLAKAFQGGILAVCVNGDVSERVKRLTEPSEFERISFIYGNPGPNGVWNGVTLTPIDFCALSHVKPGDTFVISEIPERAGFSLGEVVNDGNTDFIVSKNPKDVERLKEDRFIALVDQELPNERCWVRIAMLANNKIKRINVYFKGETRKIKNVFLKQLPDAFESTLADDPKETKGLLYELP